MKINDNHELPGPEGTKKRTVTSIKNNWIKLQVEVGMAVPKNTQTRFVGITYHIHYTSLRLLFSSTSDSIKCRYILILIHGNTVFIFHSCKRVPHIICVYTATQKASVGMYSGCNMLSLRILFVNFWHCHPYLILQFYSIVFILVAVLFLVPSGPGSSWLSLIFINAS